MMRLEKEMATHSSILVWEIPWTEKPGGLHTVHGVATSRTRLSNFNDKKYDETKLTFLCFSSYRFSQD